MIRFCICFIAALALLCAAVLQGCGGGGSTAASETHRLPDTLVVGTLYSPTSFFIYRGDTMGLDYERVNEFAKEHNIKLKFKVARSMQALLKMIKTREVQLLAYDVPVTAEFNSQVLHCGETSTTYQVLVQRTGRRRLTDVTQLVGKDVWVEKGSKYESRLHNLNNEIGGGINIHAVTNDTVSTEDLIEQVSQGKIDYTIVDSNLGKIDKTYYSDIDISMEVSFPQRSSWSVNLNDGWLADSIDAWSTSKRTLLYSEDVSRRYFERKHTQHGGSQGGSYHRRPGSISAFDDLFKRYAGSSPYDWRMLAAIAKVESDFNPNDESWAGAKGLMQIMPGTARGYGFNPAELFDPDVNVRAAVKELNVLDSYFRRRIADPLERRKFVLASYNAGRAHIIDAIKLAEKYGKDPGVWYGNVEEALKWKSNPHYYNDPVCRYGYFRSTETVSYVHKVEDTYDRFR